MARLSSFCGRYLTSFCSTWRERRVSYAFWRAETERGLTAKEKSDREDVELGVRDAGKKSSPKEYHRPGGFPEAYRTC
jgi:hypothetical protein